MKEVIVKIELVVVIEKEVMIDLLTMEGEGDDLNQEIEGKDIDHRVLEAKMSLLHLIQAARVAAFLQIAINLQVHLYQAKVTKTVVRIAMIVADAEELHKEDKDTTKHVDQEEATVQVHQVLAHHRGHYLAVQSDQKDALVTKTKHKELNNHL